MSWICPHCGTTATLQSVDVERGEGVAAITAAKTSDGIVVSWTAIRCPSGTCGRFVLDVDAHFGEMRLHGSGHRSGHVSKDRLRQVGIGNFRFEPRVGAPLSMHVPAVVKNDYEEAYLIKDLSPKAAATLCRRSLQGMVRDFHQVVRKTLHEELDAIKGHCDAELFDAMMQLKGIGNIGAHPEKDINLIVDVEEGEVETLLELLRILDKEWYVARASRSASLAAVRTLGAAKAAAKLATVTASPALPSAP